ncbi:MAG: hypothetical protein HWE30_02500 [Methylocystaceae bacterium]|nr:hypothetical protein [Methylocystaceae bacterium]
MCCLGITPVSHAQDKLVIGSFSFPPLLHLTENRKFSGTLSETIYETCEQAGIECVFRLLPLKRAYNDLRKNRVDGLVTLDLAQFNDCCLSSDWHSPWSAGFFSSDPYLSIPNKAEDTFDIPFIISHGMQSPYSFIPKMDEWIEQKKINVFKGKDIESAIRMFVHKRANLLWGGEDFKWYLNKIAPGFSYDYKPLFHKNVVLWVRKEKEEILNRFNQAYRKLIKENVIGHDGILAPKIMRQRYEEADIKLQPDS